MFIENGFWALRIEGGKKYSQVIEEPFRISMATVSSLNCDPSSKVSVYVKKDDAEFVLANLTPGTVDQQLLNITFCEGEEVCFFARNSKDSDKDINIDLIGNHLSPMGFGPEDGDEEIDSDLEAEMDEVDELEWEDNSGEEADEQEIVKSLKSTLNNNKRKIEQEKPVIAKKVKTVQETAVAVETPIAVEAPVVAEEDVTMKEVEPETKPAEKTEEKEVVKPEVEEKKAPQVTQVHLQDAEKPLTKKQKKAAAKAKREELEKKIQENSPASSPAKATATTAEKKSPAKVAPTPEKKVESKIKTFPNGLVIEDVTIGNGPKAKRGKKIFARYVGKLANGKVFDSNTGGKPFSFKLGVGQVIKGWDLGFEGMGVGGTRKLTIPAALAYGSQGAPPDIPRNATLHFEVKLMDVKN